MVSTKPKPSGWDATLSPDADIDALHTATATTDYSAFIGREESFSSDDSLPPRSRPTSRARAKKSRKAQQASDSSIKVCDRPLRPAQDILSRLRYDPALSSQNFTIGYLDRHAPEVMEMPLDNWKGGDVTDEEFIPQHRIVWFKRNEDGIKVWDRKERLDLLFGSGSSSGENEEAASVPPEAGNASNRTILADGGPTNNAGDVEVRMDSVKPVEMTEGTLL